MAIEDSTLGDLSLGDLSLGDSSLGDSSLERLLEKYGDKPLSTSYTSKTGKHSITTDNIHNDLSDYIKKIITKDVFLGKFNVFINEFDAFSDAQGKKKRCYRS